jgi:hypothetical protein
MLILEFFSYISIDYTRNHKWTKTPKGSRYMKPYNCSTWHLRKKSKEEKQNKEDR